MLDRIVDGALVPRQRRRRLLAGEFRRRRHPGLRRRARGRSRSPRCTRCASSSPGAKGRANVALADFVAPRASGSPTTSAPSRSPPGIGEDDVADRFKRANDDYSAILVKALADRLAEAFAERLHQRVRKEFWGYAAGRNARAART